MGPSRSGAKSLKLTEPPKDFNRRISVIDKVHVNPQSELVSADASAAGKKNDRWVNEDDSNARSDLLLFKTGLSWATW